MEDLAQVSIGADGARRERNRCDTEKSIKAGRSAATERDEGDLLGGTVDGECRFQPGVDGALCDGIASLQRRRFDLSTKIDETGEILQETRSLLHWFGLLGRRMIFQMPLDEFLLVDASVSVGIDGVERLFVHEMIVDARLVPAEKLRGELLARVELVARDEALIVDVEEVVQSFHGAQPIGPGERRERVDVLVEIETAVVIAIVDVEHHREELAAGPRRLPGDERLHEDVRSSGFRAGRLRRALANEGEKLALGAVAFRAVAKEGLPREVNVRFREARLAVVQCCHVSLESAAHALDECLCLRACTSG